MMNISKYITPCLVSKLKLLSFILLILLVLPAKTTANQSAIGSNNIPSDTSSISTDQANSSTHPIYLQVSAATDQVATQDTLNHPITVVMDQVDGMAGIDYNKATNQIKILQEGLYFIMATVQCGARETTNNVIKGGDLYFWYEQNGTPIPNSGTWIFASPEARAKLIVAQSIQPFKKGDTLFLKFASSAPGMGIISLPSTEYWPASPGMSFSMYMIR